MTATVPLKVLAVQARIEADQRKRDAWIKKMKASRSGESVLVGDDVTLADVHRWLTEALEN
jgi:hypothetical protein